MDEDTRGTYPPLNTLKAVAEDIWIVDGPIIHFGPPLLRMPFPTRMTIIRLAGGGLFIHSPTHLTDDLKIAVQGMGRPLWIVGPNRLHYSWIAQWREAFPQATIYLAPRIKEQAGALIDFDFLPLGGDDGYPWDADLATLPIVGSYMTEVEFFHYASRTLVLTDLIENFEPEKLGSVAMLWLTRLGGVRYPDGGMPRDMRLTFARQRPALKAAIVKMIGWMPERIIVAHGRWYEKNGSEELRRAFRWLLD